MIEKILSGFSWEGKVAFKVERLVSSEEYSSLAVLFENFSKWYALLEGMTFLFIVRVTSWVFLILVKGNVMILWQDDTSIFDPFI